MKTLSIKIMIVLVLLLSLSAVQAKVYTWVDESGKKHFGDRVPEKYREQSDKITVKPQSKPSATEQRKGPTYKDSRRRPTRSKEADRKKVAKKKEKTKKEKKKKKRYASEYDRKMAEYNESLACFRECQIPLDDRETYMGHDAFGNRMTRTVPGGFDNSACGHCKEVPMPQKR